MKGAAAAACAVLSATENYCNRTPRLSQFSPHDQQKLDQTGTTPMPFIQSLTDLGSSCPRRFARPILLGKTS